jgi:hypothetical protein
MDGPEFSLDAIIHNGKVTFCGVADRLIKFAPSFVEMGHTMPTSFAPAVVRDIQAAFLAGIKALKIDNGAAKGDIKLTTKGPMVGEIAARLSGGYMSGWTFPLATGVDVTEAALNIAVGLPPCDLTPRLKKICAERALISIPGTIERVSGKKEAGQVDGVSNVFLRVSEGDEVVFPSNNVEKCGNVIAVGNTPDEAAWAASRALGQFQLRLRPLAKVTTDYLLRDARHYCFEELPAKLRIELQSMPAFRGDPLSISLRAPLAIASMQGWERIVEKDWHGAGFADSVRLACERGGGSLLSPGGERFQLAGVFWRALARGGHQGAVYMMDSVREAGRRGRLREFLAGC